MSSQNKRSTMTLYTISSDPFCHRIKIILAEKGIVADIIDVDGSDLEELYQLNPYGKVPTLMAKDLVVYEPDIIFEYLGDRFPYPPLLSVFPWERAIARMLSKKIDTEWIPLLVDALNEKDDGKKQAYKIELLKVLFSLLPTLKRQSYLLGEEFTIVDCSMAVILYNLPKLCIKIPEQAMPLIRYARRLFKRPSFQKSIKM